jgi:hypothetical protein
MHFSLKHFGIIDSGGTSDSDLSSDSGGISDCDGIIASGEVNTCLYFGIFFLNEV